MATKTAKSSKGVRSVKVMKSPRGSKTSKEAKPVAKKGRICPDCKNTNFTEDSTRGELVCSKCGLVMQQDIIDTGQEWRAFDSEQMSRRARSGAPLTFTKHDKGLTTEIGKGLGELYKVHARKRAQYYRLTKWHKRLIKSKDRNLSFALSELQRIVSFLNLPRPIHERIARYYEEAVNKGLVRGRSIESVVAALTYAVSREFDSPRTLDEISEASGVEKREIGRTYRYIARELHVRILPANPVTFIPRFCSMLGLSDKVQAKSVEILKKAEKYDVTSGKGPTGVAAAAIYIATVLIGEKRTQREVADIVGVTEVTIRNRYKELIEKLGIEEEVEKKTNGE
ncbi:MAG: transcription initiation factor IIB [Candidatus Aenigmarchaeota archaeon]|nr:transcription initiation factor IIB [Candidatus Aenigmarchaeota archaeon]